MMIDLKQKELAEWQDRNFGMPEDTALKCALGMSEEVGEVCHHVLKGTQRIRGGKNGINKKEVADGVADVLIYGINLLSFLEINAEKEISEVIEKVLKRDWKTNPSGTNEGSPIQG
jgi:NTP pyrophosphatase (non-canonical NTP hydrolase)